jgi:hypothetical protein
MQLLLFIPGLALLLYAMYMLHTDQLAILYIKAILRIGNLLTTIGDHSLRLSKRCNDHAGQLLDMPPIDPP